MGVALASGVGPLEGAAWLAPGGGAVGFASIGVTGVGSLACRLSRFFSAVLRNALVVIRSDLFGLQSSAEMGVCSQTGHVEGNDSLPAAVSNEFGETTECSGTHNFRKSFARNRAFGRH